MSRDRRPSPEELGAKGALCEVCGDEIRRFSRTTWVHVDTTKVRTPNHPARPPASLEEDEAVTRDPRGRAALEALKTDVVCEDCGHRRLSHAPYAHDTKWALDQGVTPCTWTGCACRTYTRSERRCSACEHYESDHVAFDPIVAWYVERGAQVNSDGCRICRCRGWNVATPLS